MPGLFAGATQETPSVYEKVTKKRPVHNSTSHALEECKKFKELPILEKEKLVDEHKLWLFVLYTAVFRVVTQCSSPLTAAENRTTFLSRD